MRPHVRFEWDEAKRRSNLWRHGIDFAEVVDIFSGPTFTIADDRYDYGEKRFLTLGLLNGRVVAVVHTDSDDVIRIISARKAERHEEIQYFRERWN
jgi:uncharacterized DUF497 family protein